MYMKKWVLRFRAKDKNSFLKIKKGLKTVETRAATKRYRNIVPGDLLIIVCGKNRLEKTVRKVQIFKSVHSMIRVISYKNIMPSVASFREMEKIYYSYPGYKEKLKKFGIIALELKQ